MVEFNGVFGGWGDPCTFFLKLVVTVLVSLVIAKGLVAWCERKRD